MEIDVAVGGISARPETLRPAGRVPVESGGDVIALVRQPLEALDLQRRVELPLRGVEIHNADLDIEHVLGRHPGDRRAPDVLDSQRAWTKP